MNFGKQGLNVILRPALLILAAGSFLYSSPAVALTRIGSSAYGISVDLSVLNVVKADVRSGEGVGASTAPSYDLDGEVLNLSLDSVLATTGFFNIQTRQGLNTGLISASASSPYNGVGTSDATGEATSIVNNLALDITIHSLVPVQLLSIGATTLTANAMVDGTSGVALTRDSAITGLSIKALTLLGVGLVDIDVGLYAHANPNTVLELLGLSIIFNEQITLENAGGYSSVSTNALHLIYKDFAINGMLLNGNVVIAHAEAYINQASSTATPEPATWIQMITGFGLIGVFARRRTRRTAAV